MARVDLDDAMALLRRTPVLAACEGELVTRRELAETEAISRTTAYRATTELVEQGLLEDTGRGYLTTARGAALVTASDEFLGAIDTIDHLEPLFEIVDHPELLSHAHLLSEATVVEADATNPYRVVDRVLERWEDITRSRGVITNPTAAEAIEEAVPEITEKESIERIFTTSALDTHGTIGGDEFQAAAESDVFSVFVADEADLPFSFALDDDDVTVFGHDATTGLPTVHVESTDPAARAWLEGLYERCRECARPVGTD